MRTSLKSLALFFFFILLSSQQSFAMQGYLADEDDCIIDNEASPSEFSDHEEFRTFAAKLPKNQNVLYRKDDYIDDEKKSVDDESSSSSELAEKEKSAIYTKYLDRKHEQQVLLKKKGLLEDDTKWYKRNDIGDKRANLAPLNNNLAQQQMFEHNRITSELDKQKKIIKDYKGSYKGKIKGFFTDEYDDDPDFQKSYVYKAKQYVNENTISTIGGAIAAFGAFAIGKYAYYKTAGNDQWPKQEVEVQPPRNEIRKRWVDSSIEQEVPYQPMLKKTSRLKQEFKSPFVGCSAAYYKEKVWYEDIPEGNNPEDFVGVTETPRPDLNHGVFLEQTKTEVYQRQGTHTVTVDNSGYRNLTVEVPAVTKMVDTAWEFKDALPGNLKTAFYLGAGGAAAGYAGVKEVAQRLGPPALATTTAAALTRALNSLTGIPVVDTVMLGSAAAFGSEVNSLWLSSLQSNKKFLAICHPNFRLTYGLGEFQISINQQASREVGAENYELIKNLPGFENILKGFQDKEQLDAQLGKFNIKKVWLKGSQKDMIHRGQDNLKLLKQVIPLTKFIYAEYPNELPWWPRRLLYYSANTLNSINPNGFKWKYAGAMVAVMILLFFQGMVYLETKHFFVSPTTQSLSPHTIYKDKIVKKDTPQLTHNNKRNKMIAIISFVVSLLLILGLMFARKRRK